MQSSPFSTKTNIKHIIVLEDETSTLELCELQTITPREMINISRFFSAVNSYISVGLSYDFTFNWVQLIKELNIERHFKPGKTLDEYSQSQLSSETFYLFLFCL